MKISRQSSRWATLFGHLDESWNTLMPKHQVLTDGLVDPSILPANPKDPNSIGEESQRSSILHSKGIREVHGLVQHGLRVLVTDTENSVVTGIPSSLDGALEQAMTPQAIGFKVTQDLVVPLLTDTSGAGKKVASALFAVGMGALSCAGPIGAAAAAVIGFATFLVKLFTGRKAWKEKERKDKMRRAFQSLPPLQVGGSDSDEYQVHSVFVALQEGSWTRLFAPRFNPKKEWIGAPRNGGYGFAPGERFDTKDEFGIDTGVFEASGGIGFSPVTGKITSVVQVGLDPIGDDVEKWYKYGKTFPVKRGFVRDVGDFYKSTGWICGVAWAMATQDHASPHLFKIDVGTETTDRDEALQLMWRRYYGGAVNYIKVNGSEWEHWKGFGLKPRGRTMDPFRPEFLLGTGLGCIAGSWACYQDMRADPGYGPEQMKNRIGLYSGCVIEPRQALAQVGGRPCLVSLYDSKLRQVLAKTRERQEEFLETTLVAAYVSTEWDAFRNGGDGLLDLLTKARDAILKNKDALASIDLADVLKSEKHRGESWLQALKAAGAGKKILDRFAMREPGAIRPPSAPPPVVPESFELGFPVVEEQDWTSRLVAAAKVAGVAVSAYSIAKLIRRYR